MHVIVCMCVKFRDEIFLRGGGGGGGGGHRENVKPGKNSILKKMVERKFAAIV